MGNGELVNILHYACSVSTSVTIIKTVLERYRQSSITLPHTRIFDDRSICHVAAFFNNAKLLENLSAFDQDLEAEDADGNTPLHVAVSQNHYAAVSALVSLHVNTNPQNSKNETPFDLAKGRIKD